MKLQLEQNPIQGNLPEKITSLVSQRLAERAVFANGVLPGTCEVFSSGSPSNGPKTTYYFAPYKKPDGTQWVICGMSRPDASQYCTEIEYAPAANKKIEWEDSGVKFAFDISPIWNAQVTVKQLANPDSNASVAVEGLGSINVEGHFGFLTINSAQSVKNLGRIVATSDIRINNASVLDNVNGLIQAGNELCLVNSFLIYNESGIIAGEKGTNILHSSSLVGDATSRVGHSESNTQIKLCETSNGGFGVISSNGFGVILGKNVDIRFIKSSTVAPTTYLMGKGIIAATDRVTLSHADGCIMLPKAEIQTPQLIICAKDFQLAEQTRCAITTVNTHAQRPLKLTHEYRTLGVVRVVEVDKISFNGTECEIATPANAPGIIQQRVASGKTEPEYVNTLLATIQAKDITIVTPKAGNVLGDESAPEHPELIVVGGELKIYAMAFDGQKGNLFAKNGTIYVPKLKTGRLMKAPDMDIVVNSMPDSRVVNYFLPVRAPYIVDCTCPRAAPFTFIHKVENSVDNSINTLLGKSIVSAPHVVWGNGFFAKAPSSATRTLTMPVMISNGSYWNITENLDITGALEHYGEIDTKNLRINSTSPSVINTGKINVAMDAVLFGKFTVTGCITEFICSSFNPQTSKFVNSVDVATLIVNRQLSGNMEFINHGSIISAVSEAAGTVVKMIRTEHGSSSLPENFRRSGVVIKTEQKFEARTKTDGTVEMPLEYGKKTSGVISARTLLVPVTGAGVLGEKIIAPIVNKPALMAAMPALTTPPVTATPAIKPAAAAVITPPVPAVVTTVATPAMRQALFEKQYNYYIKAVGYPEAYAKQVATQEVNAKYGPEPQPAPMVVTTPPPQPPIAAANQQARQDYSTAMYNGFRGQGGISHDQATTMATQAVNAKYGPEPQPAPIVVTTPPPQPPIAADNQQARQDYSTAMYNGFRGQGGISHDQATTMATQAVNAKFGPEPQPTPLVVAPPPQVTPVVPAAVKPAAAITPPAPQPPVIPVIHAERQACFDTQYYHFRYSIGLDDAEARKAATQVVNARFGPEPQPAPIVVAPPPQAAPVVPAIKPPAPPVVTPPPAPVAVLPTVKPAPPAVTPPPATAAITPAIKPATPTASLARSATKGAGDCLFHAVFGVWNDNDGQFACDNVISLRTELATAIRNCGVDVLNPIFSDIRVIIQYMIIDEAQSLGLSPHFRNLKRDYQNFQAANPEPNNTAWDRFAAVLNRHDAITRYFAANALAINQRTFGTGLDINDGLLYAMIMSIEEVQSAFDAYNTETLNNGFNWDPYITPDLLQEYANMVQTPGRWMLRDELSIIAKVFHRRIELYSPGGATSFIYGATESAEAVKVYFSGGNHYERMAATTPAARPTIQAVVVPPPVVTPVIKPATPVVTPPPASAVVTPVIKPATTVVTPPPKPAVDTAAIVAKTLASITPLANTTSILTQPAVAGVESPITDLSNKSINMFKVNLTEFMQIPASINNKPRFGFEFEKRFVNNDSSNQQFYFDMLESLFLINDDNTFSEIRPPAVFSLSPDLLIDHVMDKCAHSLKHTQTIDRPYVQNLHRAMTPYALNKKINDNRFVAGLMRGQIPESVHFYFARRNIHGIDVLLPMLYLPTTRLDRLRQSFETVADAQTVLMYPSSYAPAQVQQLLSNLGGPVLTDGVGNDALVVPPAQVAPSVTPGAVNSSLTINAGAVIYAKNAAMVLEGSLTNHGDIYVEEDLLLASLFEDVRFESVKARLHSQCGNNSTTYDIMLNEARAVAGRLKIFAGNNVTFEGASAHSDYDADIMALNKILVIPLPLLYSRLEVYRQKRKTTYVTDQRITQSPSTISSTNGDANLRSGHGTVVMGSKVKANVFRANTEQGETVLAGAPETSSHSVVIDEKKRRLTGTKKFHSSDTTAITKNKPTNIDAQTVELSGTKV